MNRYIMTKGGLARFNDQYSKVREAYFSVTATNEDAADAGDNSVWHDNFAYEENQRQMHQLARRIKEMEEILTRVDLIVPPTDPERVTPGCAVTILFEDEEEERRLVIGSYDDSDPARNRVAYNAPLGQYLIGKEISDEVVISLAGKSRQAEVVAIEAACEEEV